MIFTNLGHKDINKGLEKMGVEDCVSPMQIIILFCLKDSSKGTELEYLGVYWQLKKRCVLNNLQFLES